MRRLALTIALLLIATPAFAQEERYVGRHRLWLGAEGDPGVPEALWCDLEIEAHGKRLVATAWRSGSRLDVQTRVGRSGTLYLTIRRVFPVVEGATEPWVAEDWPDWRVERWELTGRRTSPEGDYVEIAGRAKVTVATPEGMRAWASRFKTTPLADEEDALEDEDLVGQLGSSRTRYGRAGAQDRSWAGGGSPRYRSFVTDQGLRLEHDKTERYGDMAPPLPPPGPAIPRRSERSTTGLIALVAGVVVVVTLFFTVLVLRRTQGPPSKSEAHDPPEATEFLPNATRLTRGLTALKRRQSTHAGQTEELAVVAAFRRGLTLLQEAEERLKTGATCHVSFQATIAGGGLKGPDPTVKVGALYTVNIGALYAERTTPETLPINDLFGPADSIRPGVSPTVPVGELYGLEEEVEVESVETPRIVPATVPVEDLYGLEETRAEELDNAPPPVSRLVPPTVPVGEIFGIEEDASSPEPSSARLGSPPTVPVGELFDEASGTGSPIGASSGSDTGPIEGQRSS